MAIELKIGTRGTRCELTDTFTPAFLALHGLFEVDFIDDVKTENESIFGMCFACKTKYGWMCSFSHNDVLTYMGDGIWDLRVAEEAKLTRLSDAEKKVLSEPDKEFQL